MITTALGPVLPFTKSLKDPSYPISTSFNLRLGAVKSVDLAVSMRDIMNASLTVQKIADKDDFIIPARILLSLVRSFKTRKQVGEIPAINVNLAISKEYRLTREHVKSKLPEAECYWS